MKTITLSEAKSGLSAWVDASQDDIVVITRHGKPVAYLTGCEGKEFVDILAASDPEIRKALANRKKGGG